MEIDGIDIRPFRTDEWALLKATRLKALESDPRVFGSSFAKEKEYPDEEWQQRLANPKSAVFGIFHQGEIIGMTGIVIDREDPSGATAKLWGSWLEPSWRFKGLSRQMYAARLDWAKSQPSVKRIVVSHRKSNQISKRANQRHGFRFFNATETVWYNGEKETEFFYELVLKS